ncbi:MAG: dTDP-4-dehydrorhamnose reductase [bacterium]
MKKVAIIGSNGQLGSDLVEAFKKQDVEVIGLTHDDIQIENIDSVSNVLRSLAPGVILNTAAFHVAQKCEDAPDRAYAVNSQGALNVARLAQDLGALNVYFSTDYVFDGTKGLPYVEQDLPNPLNVYGSTKLLGEFLTLNYSERSIVLRVSGIYGKVPCRAKGGNFITTMLQKAKQQQEISVVFDEIVSPTPTAEIAKRLPALLGQEELGLFHLSTKGECSWFEFASTIFKTLKLSITVIPVSAKTFSSTIKRPAYSVLDTKRWKASHLKEMPHWKVALKKFLRSEYQ